MKKNLKGLEVHQNKKKQPTMKKLDNENLDDSYDSFDDEFRFDDRLIGKRTNLVFEPMSNEDGFHTIRPNPNLSTSLSIYNDSSELSFQSVNEIDEVDEKKNEKMIRYMKNIDLTNSDFSSVFSMKIEEVQESQKKEQLNQTAIVKNHQPSQNKTPLNSSIQPKSKRGSQEEKKAIEQLTIQKQKKTLTQNDEQRLLNIDKEKSTKSVKQKVQKVQQKLKSKANEVKVGKKIEEKSELKRKNDKKSKHQQEIKNQLKQLRPKSPIRQKDQVQEQKPINVTRHSTSIDRRPNQPVSTLKNDFRSSIGPVTAKVLAAKKKQQEGLKKKEENQTQRRKETNHSQEKTQPEREQFASPSPPRHFKGRKRYPNESSEEKYKPKMMAAQINTNYVAPLQEYEPFGHFGEGNRYPQRLRIEPLRYWINQKKNYHRGILQSVTLADDELGNRNYERVMEQI